MNETFEYLIRILFAGIGATAIMDLWAAVLRQFGVPSLDFALLGRWIGHFPEGRFVHQSISKAFPVRGERLLGWCAHYSIGVAFSFLLFSIYGLEWGRSPALLPALAVGVGTVVAPLFVLQPAFGAGVLSSRTPRPVFNSLKSVATHTIFGLGLYLSALGTAAILDLAFPSR